jgi:hypothetical protein
MIQRVALSNTQTLAFRSSTGGPLEILHPNFYVQ